jgi:hypothetical protein
VFEGKYFKDLLMFETNDRKYEIILNKNDKDYIKNRTKSDIVLELESNYSLHLNKIQNNSDGEDFLSSKNYKSGEI